MSTLFKLISLLAGCTRRKKLIVLTYHRIFCELDEMYPGEVDMVKFTWQMELLKRYFNVLPLADAIDHLEMGTLPPKAVCISFDDGYQSCYTEVLPVLQGFDFSACFFIVSSALEQKAMWNDSIVEAVRVISGDVLDLKYLGLDVYPLDNRAEAAKAIVASVKYLPFLERNEVCQKIVDLSAVSMPSLMLTKEQVVEMQSVGMEIGGHTMNHPILKNLTLSDAELEIRNNKLDLEQILDAPVRFFAYPNGRLGEDYDLEHADIVEACGYEAALTTDWGCIDKKSNLWQLPRFTPWDNSPLGFMLRMLIGYWKK